MNWQFPVHITGTRATISMLLKQGKKCNQNIRKTYFSLSFKITLLLEEENTYIPTYVSIVFTS